MNDLNFKTLTIAGIMILSASAFAETPNITNLIDTLGKKEIVMIPLQDNMSIMALKDKKLFDEYINDNFILVVENDIRYAKYDTTKGSPTKAALLNQDTGLIYSYQFKNGYVEKIELDIPFTTKAQALPLKEKIENNLKQNNFTMTSRWYNTDYIYEKKNITISIKVYIERDEQKYVALTISNKDIENRLKDKNHQQKIVIFEKQYKYLDDVLK